MSWLDPLPMLPLPDRAAPATAMPIAAQPLPFFMPTQLSGNRTRIITEKGAAIYGIGLSGTQPRSSYGRASPQP